MDALEQALGSVPGGKVLDVATGEGTFIETLLAHLKSYVAIIGIDAIAYTKAAGSVFCAETVHFCQMDATRLGFADESFDTASISSALHHLESISLCIAEMKRVLKPGGHLIIRETHQDVQAEPQRTDMYVHHWAAEIDSALGFTHNKTFARQELVDLIERLGLHNVAFYDVLNTDLDPMDETAIRDTEESIDRYIRYAAGLPGSRALKRRGEELRRRLCRVGIQWEPELIAVAVK
jgi:ubiquinone/menaquinone biosynthesis C-methylase UbiE